MPANQPANGAHLVGALVSFTSKGSLAFGVIEALDAYDRAHVRPFLGSPSNNLRRNLASLTVLVDGPTFLDQLADLHHRTAQQ